MSDNSKNNNTNSNYNEFQNSDEFNRNQENIDDYEDELLDFGNKFVESYNIEYMTHERQFEGSIRVLDSRQAHNSSSSSMQNVQEFSMKNSHAEEQFTQFNHSISHMPTHTNELAHPILRHRVANTCISDNTNGNEEYPTYPLTQNPSNAQNSHQNSFDRASISTVFHDKEKADSTQNQNITNEVNLNIDTSEEDKKLAFGCRICRLNHDPLCYPCKCSGSIKYVHEACLMKWLEAKYGRKDISETTCEVCGERFRFKKVYAKDAPQQLSASQFFSGLFKLVLTTLLKFFRPIFVLLTWTVIVPTTTGFLWNFYFGVDRYKYVNSFSLIGWENIVPWFVDCAFGSIVCFVIFVSCLLIAVFKEFLSNHPDLQPQLELDETENDGQRELESERTEIPQNIVNEVNQGNPDYQANVANPPNQNIAFPDQAPEEVTLDAFLGFEGPIRNLFESIAITLVFIIATLNLVVFVPYTAGYHIDNFVIGLGSRQARVPLTKNHELSLWGHALVLCKGYTIQILGFFLWTLIISGYRLLLKNDSRNRHLSKLWYYFKVCYMFIKVVAMILCNFLVTPVILGMMINLATANFFNSSVEQRLATITNLNIPNIIIHCILGMTALVYFGNIVRQVRTVIRSEVLWFLTNPDDPDFVFFRNIVQNHPLVHLRRVVMTHVLYFILVLSLVRTPLKLSRQLFPSLFPLALPGPDLKVEYFSSMDKIIILVLPLFGIASIWGFVSTYIKNWIELVSEPLGLWDYFFDQNVDDSPSDDEDVINSIRIVEPAHIHHFKLKLIAFLLITWCMIVVVISTAFLIPLCVGRVAIGLLSFRLNDVVTWTIGQSILYHIWSGISYLFNQVRDLELQEALKYVLSVLVVALKVFILGFLSFIPLADLMGHCFYSIFIYPIYPLDAHPSPPHIYLLSVGWMLESVLFRFTWYSNEGSFLHRYKEEIKQIKEQGWRNINMSRILSQLILPWYIGMSLFLFTPFLVSKYVVPLILYQGLGFPIAEVVIKQQLIQRYSHMFICCLFTSVTTLRKLTTISQKLYQKVFDQQFVVQRRLENAEGRQATVGTPAEVIE